MLIFENMNCTLWPDDGSGIVLFIRASQSSHQAFLLMPSMYPVNSYRKLVSDVEAHLVNGFLDADGQ